MTTVDTSKVSGILATTKKPPTLQDLITKATSELGKALPSHMGPERLVRIALTHIRVNPELAECTPASFLGALFTLAQLGLEPVAGRAYLLPFKNRRKMMEEGKAVWRTIKEVQAIVGYKGLVDLFYRHDKAVLLSWGVVKEKDDFDYQKGTTAFLKHKEAKGERGKVQGYWVMAELKNGGKAFEFMSADACIKHGQEHSKTWVTKKWNDQARKMEECEPHWLPDTPWVTDTDSMCLKTVLIQLSKLLPLSIEIQQAIAADETSRDYREGFDSALDMPPTTNWSDQPEDAEIIPPGPSQAPANAAKPVKADAATVKASKPDYEPGADDDL